MPFVVKLRCQGTAQSAHPVRTVAQFRYDDGWARAHDRVKQDVLVWEPTGDIRMDHLIECDHPACTRRPRRVPDTRLYPALDYARSHGKTELQLR